MARAWKQEPYPAPLPGVPGLATWYCCLLSTDAPEHIAELVSACLSFPSLSAPYSQPSLHPSLSGIQAHKDWDYT